jgi:SAM-dependent methyltransferase
MWLTTAREGRVETAAEEGRHLVRLEDGETIRVAPTRALREHGIDIEPGDSVLLRPAGDTFEIVMRRRFEAGYSPPLTIPAVDPDVEYLLAPGDPKWLHPDLPRLYDWYDHFENDLPVWRRLAAMAGGPTLELACGSGRVVRDLAQAGHLVTGVDISGHMLELAAVKLASEPPEVRERVDWIRADMTVWRSERRFGLVIIPCNSLHYMDPPVGGSLDVARRRTIETTFRHLEPGGRVAISNVAPVEDEGAPDRQPAPVLILTQASTNPNTGLFTAEYMGLFRDSKTGMRYDGPWRFVEHRPDGSTRSFEFDPPPEDPEELRLPERLPPLTRSETVAMMEEAGYVDVEIRSTDLGPAKDGDWAVMFLGRRP